MGVVWLAYNSHLNKDVAVKMLNGRIGPEAMIRFQQEARATAKLNHKNVLTVLDFGLTADRQLYLVMELIIGESLEELIHSEEPPSIEEVLEIACQICDGLEHAHSNNILHRDIKPSNVMLVEDENGERVAKLVDFGLARLTSEGEQSLTTTGTTMGSPPYLSPEQAQGGDVDVRSDIYSLGCLLFEGIAGEPPFVSDNPLSVILMHTNDPVPSLIERSEKPISRELNDLVTKCIAKEPDQRFQSASELKAAINDVLESLRLSEELTFEGITGRVIKNEDLPQYLRSLYMFTAFCVVVLAFCGSFVVKGMINEPPKAEETPSTSWEPMSDTGAELAEAMGSRDEFMKMARGKKDIVWWEAEEYLTDRNIESFKKYYDQSPVPRVRFVGRPIEGWGLKSLTEFPLLEVQFDECKKLQNQGLKYIGEMKTLQKVSISDCPLIDDKGIKYLCKLPELADLQIENCGISTSVLEELASVPTLLYLKISFLHNKKSDPFVKLGYCKDFPLNLAGLCIRNATIEKGFVDTLKKAGSRFRVLDVANCSIARSAVRDLVSVPALELHLGGTDIQNSDLRLLEGNRDVKRLSLVGSKQLSEAAIKRLSDARPDMKIRSDYSLSEREEQKIEDKKLRKARRKARKS